jgi:hypothetical protein
VKERGVIAWLVGSLLVAAILAPGAAAGKPTFERINIDETIADEFLSEACGVEVTTRARGHIIIRTFSGGGTGPAEIRTINIALTAMADGNTYRFRDVGADITRVQPDGTVILSVIGQIPFDFTGVLKINVTTGDVILEPHHSLAGNVAKACAVLTA